MRRGNSLLVNLIVMASLVLGSLPLGLAAASRPPGTISASAIRASAPALAASHPNHTRERRQDRKKHGQNEKHRKTPRRNHHHHRTQRLPTGVFPGADSVEPAPGEPPDVEDHYIVRLRDGAGNEIRAAKDLASGLDGVVPTHVYQYVFSGFAAVIPPDKLAAVRADPRVEAVIPDQVVYADLQTVPTGVDRIDADQSSTAHIDGQDERVDVDVAVIDSAGNDSHPDLNIWAWADCTPFRDQHDDDMGHGTHVGGIIGALDNGVGSVGVAPGARLWNIRVMIGGGFSSESWIICGLDLVTKYATDQGDGYGDIEVANVSLGRTGTDSNCATAVNDLFHQAFCRMVAAGVTVAVAAGNDAHDAALDVPAAYDEVITVSALADSDGQPGGNGPDTAWGPDDTLAEFSNFGADVDLAAPGVSILSTVPTGFCDLCRASGYRHLSGTSMATPFVAGAAALYLATHPGASPAQVKAALLAGRQTVHLAGDPDGIDEGVLRVGPGSGIGVVAAGRGSGLTPASDGIQAETRGSDSEQRDRRQVQAKRLPSRHRR